MPARLIVNADDFGLTRGINRAIAELHTAGALTSATLMANGPAFDDAVAIARAHPTLGIGCHIVLTDGVPLAPPDQIPSLLTSDGKNFRASLADFIHALLRGAIKSEEIALEASLQIEKLRQAGIQVTHLDTHKHTHIFPQVARPLIALAARNCIPAIRNPFEPVWEQALHLGSLPRRLAVRAMALFEPQFKALLTATGARVTTTDGTLAISATGDLTQTTLSEILAALPPTGTYELCCHPGYNDPDLDRITTRLRTHRETEREALLSEITALSTKPNQPELISYAGLATK
jgi:predicted glycoside hydrolase/deacetylase ChbG (UPF0249 family)